MTVSFTADPSLVLDFLGTFSRLEYSLKVTQFRLNGDGEAKANWPAFVATIEPHFNPDENPEVGPAYQYLVRNPPKSLVVVDGAVLWAAHVEKVNRRLTERCGL